MKFLKNIGKVFTNLDFSWFTLAPQNRTGVEYDKEYFQRRYKLPDTFFEDPEKTVARTWMEAGNSLRSAMGIERVDFDEWWKFYEERRKKDGCDSYSHGQLWDYYYDKYVDEKD